MWNPASFFAYFSDLAAHMPPCSLRASFSSFLKHAELTPISQVLAFSASSSKRTWLVSFYQLGLSSEITSGRPSLTQVSHAPSPSLSRLSLPFCILYNTVAMWKHHVCLFVCVVCSLSPPCVCKCLWSRALCHLLPSVPSIVEQWLTHSKH